MNERNINQSDWDFTGIKEQEVAAAVVWEYTRSSDLAKLVLYYLSTPFKWYFDKSVREVVMGYCENPRWKGDFVLGGHVVIDTLRLLDGPADVPDEIGGELFSLASWTLGLSPVLGMVSIAPDLDQPWASLKNEPRTAITAYICEYFTGVASAIPGSHNAFIRLKHLGRINSLVRELRPTFRVTKKNRARAAEPPFVLLEQLGAFRFTEANVPHSQALVVMKGCCKRAGYQCNPSKYKDPSQWSRKVHAARKLIADASKGDFSFLCGRVSRT